MKNMMFILPVLLLAACGISKKDGEKLAFGEPPANYEKKLISIIKNQLKDPDSIKVESITKPRRGYATYGFGTKEYGWYIEIRYNAKNSYGAYAGFDTVHYLYNGSYEVPHTYEINYIDKKEYACNSNCSY